MARERKEERHSKRRLKNSYISTIVGMSLVLFMLGLLALIILNARKVSNHVKENIGFTVYMKDKVKEVDVIRLKKTFDAAKYIKSSMYITKEAAAKELKNELGEDFVDFLGYIPIPASIDLRLKASYANSDSIRIIEKKILDNSDVKEIHYQKDLVQQINRNVRKISFTILGFSGLFFLVAISLINNTIRLSVNSRRFLIKSMQLIGATQSFIRRPFILRGVIQGLISSVLSIILLCGVLYLAYKEIPEIVNKNDVQMIIYLFGLVVFLAITISWISNFFAVRKYLKIKTDLLYY